MKRNLSARSLAQLLLNGTFAIGLLLSLACLRTARAHETWLLPAAFDCVPGSPVKVSLTSGMDFPALDYAIQAQRVAVAECRLDEVIVPLPKPTREVSSLEFPCLFQKAGLVTAWVILHPKTLELSEDKVAEYFAEIDAPADVRERWARFRGKRVWRETYTKCAKTFLLVGPASADKSWTEPVRMPLEIVPQGDSMALKVGESFTVLLLEKGGVLGGASIALINPGSHRVFQKTDAEGRARFTPDSAGPALLFAVQLRWHEDHWLSTFTTLCVRVER